MQQQKKRSGIILGLVALGLLTGVAMTAGPAQAASGAGPYYAEPTWDRKLPTATRFLILTNWNSEAVLDKETGLVWEKSPDPIPQPWFQARQVCANRTISGRMGWRLPSVDELASLIDPGVVSPGPTLPPGHPFLHVIGGTTNRDYYWSATTTVESPTSAWAVSFGTSDVTFGPKADSIGLPVWCVRGGMNAAAY